MKAYISIFLALASVSLARSQNYYYKPYVVPEQQIRPVRANPTSPPPSYPTSPYEQTYPAKYDFAWQVLDSYSGNDYAQQESREGKSTTGSYHVALPDGRIQRVTYTVDGYGGYQAEVTYEGAATYPEAKPYVQPPRPSYPVQPYSAASESRPSYVSQPEAKAVEVTAKPEPVQEAQAIVAPVTEAPAPVVVTSLPPSNIRRYSYRTTSPLVIKAAEPKVVEPVAEAREDVVVPTLDEVAEASVEEVSEDEKPYQQQQPSHYFYRYY